MNKSYRKRFVWTFVCSLSVVMGIVDFYLNWIRPLKFIDFMSNNIFSIIGIIGFLTLIAIWLYWKVTDFLVVQKSQFEKLSKNIQDCAFVINNHAECINTKTDIGWKKNPNSSFGAEKIEVIEPLRININEHH